MRDFENNDNMLDWIVWKILIMGQIRFLKKCEWQKLNIMNTLGLSLILKMGCFCTKETININGTKYVVKERLGEG